MLDKVQQGAQHVVEDRKPRHFIAMAILAHLTEAGNARRPAHGEDHAGVAGAHVVGDRLQLCARGEGGPRVPLFEQQEMQLPNALVVIE